MHTIIIRDDGTVGNIVPDGSGQTKSRTSSLTNFSTSCMHKILIPTTLSKKVLLSLATASLTKPDFVQRRSFIDQNIVSVEFIFNIEFAILFK